MVQVTSTARARWIRLAALAGVLVATYAGLRLAGVDLSLDAERLRQAIQGAGTVGYALFAGFFVVGQLVHVPGNVFVGTAAVVYGRPLGFALSLFSAVLAVAVSFAIIRAVGGKALAEIERPFVQRLLSRLDERPVRTVFLLRLVLWLNPGLTYALALSNIRFRDFVVGSALGLVLPVLGATFLFNWLLA